MIIEFCVPIYNEEKILEKNILYLINFLNKQKFDFSWTVVAIVNGSTDNSLEVCKKIRKTFPDKFRYANAGNGKGKGLALKKYFLSSQSDILAYMDIDLAVSLSDMPKLIFPIIDGQADLVIGSRLMFDSKINRSFFRELSSQTYNFLSRIILNHKFSDLQCGFKAIKTEHFKKLSHLIKNKSWFFDTELIIFANETRFQIKEIAVDWSENRYDERKSKINLLKDSLKFFFNLIELKIRLLKNNRRKEPAK